MASRFGGMNLWFARIAVGFLIGPLIGLLTGLIAGFTGGLGLIGQVVYYALLGWIVVLVVGLVLRAIGGRR